MELFGKNVALELLEKKQKIDKIILLREFSDKNILSLIKENNIDYKYEDKKYFNRFEQYNHQGIICIVPEFNYASFDFLKNINKDNPFVIMLDHIEDPHNFGAIIRTAVAAGVDAIIIPKERAGDVTPTVFKTSAGAAFKIPIIKVANLNNAISEMKDMGYWFVGTSLDTDKRYDSIDYNFKACLVVGNEGKGISQLVAKNCDYLVKIPQTTLVESLNVSVATGIMIYEINKTRW